MGLFTLGRSARVAQSVPRTCQIKGSYTEVTRKRTRQIKGSSDKVDSSKAEGTADVNGGGR